MRERRDLRHRHRPRERPGGAPPDDDARPRDGRAADGGAQSHRQAAVLRGDARLVHRHLHRQDRDDHEEPDDGPGGVGPRDPGRGDRRGVRADGAVLVDGRPATDADLARSCPLFVSDICATPRRSSHPEAMERSGVRTGDPTEGALLVAAAKAGLDRDVDLRTRPVVRKLAFEPKRKRMSTIHQALPRRVRSSPT